MVFLPLLLLLGLGASREAQLFFFQCESDSWPTRVLRVKASAPSKRQRAARKALERKWTGQGRRGIKRVHLSLAGLVLQTDILLGTS